jgi:acylphosphatase
MERRQIVFTGRVQGVGFRATARAVARRHEVSGWVRNQSDGSVLMEVQGVPGAIEGYLEDLRARLRGLIAGEAVSMIPAIPGEASLEIRR